MQEIVVDGTVYEFPDEMSDAEIMQALQLERPTSEPTVSAPLPKPDSFLDNALDVAGEAAAGANRAFVDTLDFLGPGSVNAALRLAGVDAQIPTFGEAFRENAPGAEGGFMEPGTARDVVQAAGATIPAAGSLVPAAGRNLATIPGALAEITGFGTAGPTASAVDTAQDSLNSLLLAGGDQPAVPMAARADAAGFPISPGERTGSEMLRRIEAGIESTPMPGNPMLRQAKRRQQMMNDAATDALGLERGTPLTDDVMGATADDLSDRFKALDIEDDLTETEGFVSRLVDIQDASRSRLRGSPDTETLIDDIFDRLDDQGAMSVSDYQDMSSELKAIGRSPAARQSPDPFYRETLGDIVSALDELAEGQADPATIESLRDARSKWRALKQLEDSRSVRESGDVSAPLLANYLRRTDRGGYGRGGNRSPLYEIPRLEKAFPRRQDSGTADRIFFNDLMNNPVMALATLPLRTAASAAANAYYTGTPLVLRSAQGAGLQPGLMARLGGILQGDNEDEASIPYLYD